MPARARTIQGASPGFPRGERVDPSRASRARCCGVRAHVERTHDESRRAVVVAVVISHREVGRVLAAAFLGGEWVVERDVGARPARVGRRAWLRDGDRCEVLAAYHRPPLDRPRELAAYIAIVLDERRRPPRVPPACERRAAVSPGDGVRCAGRCRGSTRSATWRRSSSWTWASSSGSRTCAALERRGARRAAAPLPLHAAAARGRAAAGDRGAEAAAEGAAAPDPARDPRLDRRSTRPRTGSSAAARRAPTRRCTRAAAWSSRLDLEDFFAGVRPRASSGSSARPAIPRASRTS